MIAIVYLHPMLFAVIRTLRSVSSALTIFSMSSVFMTGCAMHDVYNDERVRDELLYEVNKLRSEGCHCGDTFMPPVNELQWNTALEIAAQNHADDLYEHNYLDHLSPDGTSPIMRAEQAGYDGQYVGENIARGYYRTRDVVAGWKNSESHCMAMMDGLYTDAGGAKREDYWVLDFGHH